MNQIAESVARLLESPAGIRKTEQLTSHLERIAKHAEATKLQVSRLGKRRGVQFYGNLGAVHEHALSIDVRVFGRSCGTVELKPGRSRRWFRGKTIGAVTPPAPSEWKDARVRDFLEAVGPVIQQREATVEGALLEHMAQRSSATKPRALLDHQPVKLLGVLPFQFPLPIAARETPEIARGHRMGYVDVLARAGRGGRRLRVFEVKAQGAPDIEHALDQAVTYCAAVEFLLNRMPSIFLTSFGMTPTPRKLSIDAVAFVPDNATSRRAVERSARRLLDGGDRFGLAAQFFRWQGSGPAQELVIQEEVSFSGRSAV